MRIITGMFKDQESVNQVLGALGNVGVQPEEVSLVVSHAIHGRGLGIVDTSSGPVRAVVGAATGGVLGALAATGLAAGITVFPRIGVVAAGPVVATLKAVGAGRLTGGLIGALVDAGAPRRVATMLEAAVARGKILLTVHVDGGREELVREVLHAAGAEIAMAA